MLTNPQQIRALRYAVGVTIATALAFSEYIKNEDMLTNGAAWTKVEASAITDGAGAAATFGYQWEVKAEELDMDTFGSENTYLRCNVASTDGNVTAAIVIYDMYEPIDAKSSDGMPSIA